MTTQKDVIVVGGAEFLAGTKAARESSAHELAETRRVAEDANNDGVVSNTEAAAFDNVKPSSDGWKTFQPLTSS